ncbi:MAG: hypothetical protein KDD56_04045 [Bdellovibrionales bacterium]|nr:hypothetical protein [Bdellovibrionales bacterium]
MCSRTLIIITIFSYCAIFTTAVPASSFAQQLRQHTDFEVKLLKKKKRGRRPECSDKRDNDSDGYKNYPLDPGCSSKRDRSENSDSLRSEGVGPLASLLGRRPFPDNNPWNQDISAAEVDSNSANLIESIGLETGLHPDFGTVWNGALNGIPYNVIAGPDKFRSVSFYYEDESDIGPYPIPKLPLIEGGPKSEGDRHILIIDKDNWKLYELYDARRTSSGWTAGSGAIFDLNSNDLRPAGWTSADAAGLPIFPGLVRYDEVVEQGEINHALRFTVSNTRRAYVSPARHWASSDSDPNLPPMGMRVRLKADFDISGFSENIQVILRALKKYGMFVADNGSDWFISGAPDPRWDDDQLSELREVKGSDFEVVKMDHIVTE